MKKAIRQAYVVCVFLICVLFLLATFTSKLVVRETSGREDTVRTEELNIVVPAISEEKGKDIYTFSVTEDWVKKGHLIFYTVHQNVSVYVGQNMIYKMAKDYRNAFGKTSGCVFVDVPIWQQYAGQKLRVEITPVYKTSKGIVPTFYVGNRFQIFRQEYRNSWASIMMCILSILIGIVFCVYIVVNRENKEVDKCPALIGTFAILLGVWKLTDLKVINLIVPNRPGISYIPFVCLALMPIPALLFLRSLCQKKEEKAWNYFCIVSEVQCAVVVGLQYFDILDFRQTLMSTWAIIIAGLALIAVMYVKDIMENGMNAKMRLSLICLLMCVIGTAIDMITYMVWHFAATSSYQLMFFLAYVILVGVDAYKQSIELASAAQKTERYENQAFHDQLTGLYNRTALETDLQLMEYNDKCGIIINFDLNNLKKCNDTLGHEKGDKYIKDSAQVISDCFSKLGKIYRTGGDEFYCLAENGKLEECKQAIVMLREACADYNVNGSDIHMSIAIGYALYDRLMDYGFSDTMKRADKMMYENKAQLKLLEAQNNLV